MTVVLCPLARLSSFFFSLVCVIVFTASLDKEYVNHSLNRVITFILWCLERCGYVEVTGN